MSGKNLSALDVKTFLKGKLHIVAVIVLLVTAAFLRFFFIDKVPCGVFADQATNALEGLRVTGGMIRPLYGAKEALFLFLLGIAQMFFGTGIWQIFIVSATIGTATVISTYFAVKEVFNRKIAFLTGFFLAVSGWHIALSRNGFRATLIPLIISLFVYCFARAFFSKDDHIKKIFYPLAAGVCALGFYTYYAYWFFVFTIFLFGLFYVFMNRSNLAEIIRKRKKDIRNFLAVFIIVVLPIALYLVIFPARYFVRAGEISIFSEGKSFIDIFSFLIQNFWQTFSGIFYIGDLNWRHNPTGSSLLFPLLTPFFFVTVFYAIWKRKERIIMMVALFFIMLVPGVLTNEGVAPHGLRIVGIIPVLFVIASISVSWLLEFKKKFFKTGGLIIVGILMIAATHTGFHDYFRAIDSEHYYRDFRCEYTQAAHFVRDNYDDVIIISDIFEFESIKYLLLPQEIHYQEPAEFIENFHEPYVKGKKVVFLSTYGQYDKDLMAFLTEHYAVKEEMRNKFGSIDYYVFSD